MAVLPVLSVRVELRLSVVAGMDLPHEPPLAIIKKAVYLLFRKLCLHNSVCPLRIRK